MGEGLPDGGSLPPLESMARREWGGFPAVSSRGGTPLFPDAYIRELRECRRAVENAHRRCGDFGLSRGVTPVESARLMKRAFLVLVATLFAAVSHAQQGEAFMGRGVRGY